MRTEIHKDGGWKSRKIWFGVGTQLMILAGAFVAAKMSTFGPFYSEMVSGLVGVCAIVLTGNVATKWVASKMPQDKEEKKPANPNAD